MDGWMVSGLIRGLEGDREEDGVKGSRRIRTGGALIFTSPPPSLLLSIIHPSHPI